MLGVSGVSSDFRDLTAAKAAGNKRAALALDLFIYNCKKYVGAYAAAMNGVGIAMQVCVPRYFEKQFRKDTMLTYGFLGAAGFMALFVDHGKIIGSFTGPGGMKVLVSALALSVFCTLVANTIFVKSASYVEPATTTILSALEVVVGAIVGLLLFHEVLTAIQIVGAVIIVVASLGMELVEKPAAKPEEQSKQ
jgi:drug/metabolite transporter (DMT)-like permease